MPGIAQRNNNSTDHNIDTNTNYQNPLVGNGTLPFHSFHGSSVSNCGFWSRHRDDVSYNQLQKFWYELTPQARKKLLRIDKQTLFEHARKNMYCSRCNGLLLEGFLQIVMYGKSIQHDAAAGLYGVIAINSKNDADLCIGNGFQEDGQDPHVHPWGGLTTARDGTLTLLDSYLYSKCLKGIQNVFDSARARERERELLYPDACGGGGRGWTSQGMAGYGRGHGTRETCALHTARLSVDTLVDFWSALGEETRQSLLRMNEEDFIERLMYRFDSKRFCRDCRRNVIREFKELKELKRMRKEPRCTSWFCVADTAFQYEVSRDTVQADWHQTFLDAFGTYHHFEWAIGTGEGKSDILEFENVGLSGRVQVNGLDLSGLNACYITLRAWKMDGRCNELCVKAHALRGQQCVHCRLVVGDGFVTITRGESIRRFFEHAEEAEEEEDDDSLDNDGNECDGECSRPQKHAKSPELAQEYLLDAATVIFKEQVEKAFREGTARQNAHSIFVCLALKLLEERLHVACKEIITLEKQMKLLEEEEREKREEKERKERRRAKEREKKLRRKERSREKENREKKCAESHIDPLVSDVSKEEPTPCINEGANVVSIGNSVGETGEVTPASPPSSDIQDDQLLTEYIHSNMENQFEDSPDGDFGNTREWNTSFSYDHFKYSRRKPRFPKDTQQDLNLKWSGRRKPVSLPDSGVAFSKYEGRYHGDGFESMRNTNGYKQIRTNTAKSNARNGGLKLNEKFQCTNYSVGDRDGSHGCSCTHTRDYRLRPDSRLDKVVREPKYVTKLDSPPDTSQPYYRGNKYTQVDGARELNGRIKSNIIAGNPNTKKVWEPLDSQKKYVRSNSDSDVTLRSTSKVETFECDQHPEYTGTMSSDEVTDSSVQTYNHDTDSRDLMQSSEEICMDNENVFHSVKKSPNYEEAVAEDGKLCSMTGSPHRTLGSSISSSSNSDNCSSCFSEGDSNMSSSNPQNLESTSSSDSEESSQNLGGRDALHGLENGSTQGQRFEEDESIRMGQDAEIQGTCSGRTIPLSSLPVKAVPYYENENVNVSVVAQRQSMLPTMHNQSIRYQPIFQARTMGYYHQSPVSWQAGPANGLMPFPHFNHYLLANSFGYGLNGNSRFMQYAPLQHLAPSLLNTAHSQPVTHVNGVGTEEPTKVANLGGLQELQRSTTKTHIKVVDLCPQKEVQHGIQKVASTGSPLPTGASDDAGENVKPGKMDKGNDGFSLFYFGGPVALSTGIKAHPVLSKEGSGNSAPSCPDSDHSRNKKDFIEEYNLFAASNGLKFSFF